jgi:cell division protein FtsW (lipid II flippase)
LWLLPSVPGGALVAAATEGGGWFGRGVKDSKDHRVFLPLSGSFSLFFMTPICMVFRFVIVVTLLFNEMWLFSKRKKNLNLKTVVTRD